MPFLTPLQNARVASVSLRDALMNIETFRELVERARRENPRCCYCGRDLSQATTKEVMYMKGQKRIACRDCPEAISIGDN